MHPIKMTNKQIQEAISMLRKQLKNSKTTNSTIELKYKLPMADVPKATLVVEELAWNKMVALVDMCDKEIAWHGIVFKENNVYTVKDIVVFPQEVTGATVTSNETEYSMWLMQQPDDVFNNLRFHGHSHVNMATRPSGVDTSYQEDILKNLKDFYIFAILNKKGDHWLSIYDVEDNIAYEDKDITLVLPDTEVEEWAMEEIKTKVRAKQPSRPVATPKYKPPYTPKPSESTEPSYAAQYVDKLYNKHGKKKTVEELEAEALEEEEYLYGLQNHFGGYYG